MFGTIKPCYSYMQKEEQQEYRKYYCALCVGMKHCSGGLSRIFVNYEMCYAYMILDSVNQDTEETHTFCPVKMKHMPCKVPGTLLDKLCEINFLLTYYKVYDDILDDENPGAKFLAKIMQKKFEELSAKQFHAAEIIETHMKRIHIMEQKNEFVSIETAAGHFGELLGEVIAECVDDPMDAKIVKLMMRGIGMWVYTIDACSDLIKDAKHHKYNPIYAGMTEPYDKAIEIRKAELVSFLIKCKSIVMQTFELYDLNKNRELIYRIFDKALPEAVSRILS